MEYTKEIIEQWVAQPEDHQEDMAALFNFKDIPNNLFFNVKMESSSRRFIIKFYVHAFRKHYDGITHQLQLSKDQTIEIDIHGKEQEFFINCLEVDHLIKGKAKEFKKSKTLILKQLDRHNKNEERLDKLIEEKMWIAPKDLNVYKAYLGAEKKQKKKLHPIYSKLNRAKNSKYVKKHLEEYFNISLPSNLIYEFGISTVGRDNFHFSPNRELIYYENICIDTMQFPMPGIYIKTDIDVRKNLDQESLAIIEHTRLKKGNNKASFFSFGEEESIETLVEQAQDLSLYAKAYDILQSKFGFKLAELNAINSNNIHVKLHLRDIKDILCFMTEKEKESIDG